MTHLRDVPCGPTLRSDSARGESHYPSPGGSPWRPETPRALVCASTFSRAAQPYRLCSAAFPAATRRAPGGETRGPPRPTSPLTRAGRFPLPSAPGHPRRPDSCLCSRGGKPQRFPEPSGSTVTAAQPPTLRLAPVWGAARAAPPQRPPSRGRGSPPGSGPPACGDTSGLCAENGCDGPHVRTSSVRSTQPPARTPIARLGDVGNKADEARLLGGGETGFIGVRRAGRFLPSAWVSGPRWRRGCELADHARNARPCAALVHGDPR